MQNQKKILYVEDLIMSVRIVQTMLKKQYELDYALNIRDALEKINSNSYDLILLDINLELPMDGLVFARKLREEQLFKNPILLITAYQFNYNASALRELGVNGYLQKPFNKEQLLDKINELI